MTHPLVDLVREAGVVGAGGAGFPTHVKIDNRIEILIANGTECDPLLHADQNLMARHPREVLKGLKLLREATGATRTLLATKREYESAVTALKQAGAGKDGLELHLGDSVYPAGDEFVLVYELTGRRIPETGLPLHVDCLVHNVATLYQIAQAHEGKPVTERYVTVSGDVNEPKTVIAPIGTPIGDLLQAVGGLRQPAWERGTARSATLDEHCIVVGGPMMGKLAVSLDDPVLKTTSGVLFLPAQNAVARYLGRPTGSWVRRGRSTCDQCRDCTDLCPRYLLGHNLKPHEVMRSINYGLTQQPDIITAAVLCCECRLCEAYACPLELSPMAYYVSLKKALREAGWTNDVHRRKEFDPHPMREYRQVPTKRLIAHLGLAEYAQRGAPLADRPLRPKKVRIPLKQHIGAPSEPAVSVGQKVEVGTLIGRIPEGKLGANVHASISGTVREVTPEAIEIEQK
jgi:Na+-translocating ferredoxin:NAD+ oxidoreductase RnfC subunit